MNVVSLTSLGEEQLEAARAAHAGRAAHTVHGGHDHSLRQTVIALAAGHRLDDHESPGEATLFVLKGHVRLGTPAESVDGTVGDLLVIPGERHHLEGVEDSVVLLTVVKAV
ncbi:cupin [Mycolicibacterium sp.]|uniref:cupin n=1 Tax=Mycolicibacterium sp. TaxID=2320850 RepID=UPI003D11FFA9